MRRNNQSSGSFLSNFQSFSNPDSENRIIEKVIHLTIPDFLSSGQLTFLCSSRCILIGISFVNQSAGLVGCIEPGYESSDGYKTKKTGQIVPCLGFCIQIYIPQQHDNHNKTSNHTSS